MRFAAAAAASRSRWAWRSRRQPRAGPAISQRRKTCAWSGTTTCRPAARTSRRSTIRATAGSPISAITAAPTPSRTRNPLTGKEEPNGTSIVDVTDPAHPKYLHHIPGQPGTYESGGAQMARVCDGSALPKGDRNAVYLLRAVGQEAHEIWNVADPANPVLITRLAGLQDTHKSWWECDTGIAYLVSGAPGWRVKRMTQVYDLSDPAHPVHIRDFGLPGQEPGATRRGADRAAWPDLDRAERQPDLFRLRHRQGRHAADRRPRQAAARPGGADPGEPSAPEIGRLTMTSSNGAHTTFPMLDMAIPEFAHDKEGSQPRHRHDRGRGDPERMQRAAADGLVRRHQRSRTGR